MERAQCEGGEGEADTKREKIRLCPVCFFMLR